MWGKRTGFCTIHREFHWSRLMSLLQRSPSDLSFITRSMRCVSESTSWAARGRYWRNMKKSLQDRTVMMLRFEILMGQREMMNDGVVGWWMVGWRDDRDPSCFRGKLHSSNNFPEIQCSINIDMLNIMEQEHSHNNLESRFQAQFSLRSCKAALHGNAGYKQCKLSPNIHPNTVLLSNMLYFANSSFFHIIKHFKVITDLEDLPLFQKWFDSPAGTLVTSLIILCKHKQNRDLVLPGVIAHWTAENMN